MINNYFNTLENSTATMKSNQTVKSIISSGATDCRNYDLIMNLIVKVCLLVLGCFGNSLSIIVMWNERNKSATAFLLIVLSVIDSLVLFSWLFNLMGGE